MSTLAHRPVLSDLVWNAEGTQLWLKRIALLVCNAVDQFATDCRRGRLTDGF